MTPLIPQRGRGRDWKDYNKKLVARGEFMLDLSWLDSWLEEVKQLNLCKVGQPFLYPDCLVRFLAMLRAKGFAYRELSGLLEALSKRLGPFPVMSFSQVRRRILSMGLSFASLPKDAIIGIDGTGLKVSNRGEWIRHKWAVKKGWVKVVLMGTITGDVIDVIVGDETLDERKSARELLKKHQPKQALLDGLHDVKETYNLCEKQGITLTVPARKNARSRGLNPRAYAVREQKKVGRDAWRDKYKYGHRWVATEGEFSAVKRIFGENLASHKEENLYKEAKIKFWAYQQLRKATT